MEPEASRTSPFPFTFSLRLLLEERERLLAERQLVHVMREDSARPQAFRLICGANPRQEYAWVVDLDHVAEPQKWGDGDNNMAEVTCPKCLAILDREAQAAA